MTGYGACNAVWLATLRLLARVWYLGLIIATVVVLSYSSKHDTKNALKEDGGLNGCFHCGAGWNWHVLLFTLAFGLCEVEGLLTFYGYGCVPA